MRVTGADLPELGWQHVKKFKLTKIRPLYIDKFSSVKPLGGLWTSPLLPDGTTGWVHWKIDAGYGDPDLPLTRLRAHPDARVWVIDELADLEALGREFPGDATEDWQIAMLGLNGGVDWLAAATGHDAVWLTARGERWTRFSRPGLYGWDCETVFFLNPTVSLSPPSAGAAPRSPQPGSAVSCRPGSDEPAQQG